VQFVSEVQLQGARHHHRRRRHHRHEQRALPHRDSPALAEGLQDEQAAQSTEQSAHQPLHGSQQWKVGFAFHDIERLDIFRSDDLHDDNLNNATTNCAANQLLSEESVDAVEIVVADDYKTASLAAEKFL
jgi:hypothetical protein